MKRILLAFAISLGIIGAIKAEERSYSIVFGADNASTTSLTKLDLHRRHKGRKKLCGEGYERRQRLS